MSYEGKTEQEVVYVWICTGRGAFAYHLKSNCRGLNRCKSEIKNITLLDAITQWHRDKCRNCY